jgi:hypothetical protein
MKKSAKVKKDRKRENEESGRLTTTDEEAPP